MPRNIDSATQGQLGSNQIRLAFLLQITFKSETCYLSTLPYNLIWNGQTWVGTGSLGSVGTVTESTDVQAYGTSVTLSGIDPTLLSESLGDIQLGAPAVLYVAFFDDLGNIMGNPTVIFGGQVDKPSIVGGPDTVSITLNLESEMINLQRGQFRRLTDADQRIDYPDDCSMQWVGLLNYMALRWGT